MINKISFKTKAAILKKLVYIHKQCVLESNSKYYDSEQIKEWVSTISIQNIKDQLGNSNWIVIKEKNDIVGFAQYSIEDKEIYQIQIYPKKQRLGYGKRLYEYIENDFKTNNIKEIELFATLNGVPFYKKMGFKAEKNIKLKLINKKVDMVKMSKSLPISFTDGIIFK